MFENFFLDILAPLEMLGAAFYFYITPLRYTTELYHTAFRSIRLCYILYTTNKTNIPNHQLFRLKPSSTLSLLQPFRPWPP